jgi:hypothetical protein
MKQYIILICFIATILLTTTILAVEPTQEGNEEEGFQTQNEDETLTIGKNNYTTSESFQPIYVKDFINLYPEIEAISFKDGEKTIGFVNFLDGIGENFIIYPEREYEIATKAEIIIQSS